MSKPAEQVWAWLREQLGDKFAMLMTFAVFVGIGVSWARSETRDAAHEVTDPVLLEQERQRRLMERYEADVHEFAKDLRELYRVSPFVRRSERLERPFPDHGDGGE